MKLFTHRDGTQYVARDEADLLSQLNRTSFSRRDSDVEFMTDMAERATMISGQRIRADSPEHFVKDLVAAGIISVAEIHQN